MAELIGDLNEHPLLQFIHANDSRVLNRGRIRIVDYLNVMLTYAKHPATLADFCNYLQALWPGSPLIIVTKKTKKWPAINADEAGKLTKKANNILVLEVDTLGKHKTSARNEADLLLAECDDHLLAFVAEIINLGNCAPIIMSADWLRNKLSINKNAPNYYYKAYFGGNTSVHLMDQKKVANVRILMGIMSAGFNLSCCYTPRTSSCYVCKRRVTYVCRNCNKCYSCQYNLLEKAIKYMSKTSLVEKICPLG